MLNALKKCVFYFFLLKKAHSILIISILNYLKILKNMNRKNTIRLTESELKNIITESVKMVLKEETTKTNIPYETLEHIRDLCQILSMAKRIRAGFRGFLYGGQTPDGGYFNGLRDEKITPYMQQLYDSAMSVEHAAESKLDEFDSELVDEVRKMTHPDVLYGYL